jgi:peptidoglycan hydrolase CwlO-like protein
MEECFRRLEERVREVLQGYNRLRQEKEVLADKLRLKDKSIDELNQKLKALDERKNSVKARIERLIQRIEGLGF